MSTEKALKKKKKKLEKKIRKNKSQTIEAIRNKIFECGCGEKQPLKDYYLFIKYWYVAPYSCTGGDYWKISDSITFYCTICGNTNRLLGNRIQEEHDFGFNIEKIFKGIVKVYQESGHDDIYYIGDEKEEISKIEGKEIDSGNFYNHKDPEVDRKLSNIISDKKLLTIIKDHANDTYNFRSKLLDYGYKI